MTDTPTRLESRRRALNLTQVELASAVGVSQASISAYETGAAMPRLRIAHRIAAALDTTPGELFLTPDEVAS